MAFDPEYVSRVLRENFEDAKALFLSPLIAIHYAHLVMLRRQGIVSAADARALRDALDAISLPAVMATPFDQACEDLFFHLERLLIQACGEDVAGRLRETIFAAHTHTQPAQPTTIAHYLLAIIEQLERDHVRLQAAYVSTNK